VAQDPRRDLGALGERIACDHLRKSGYTVVERNFRTRGGEIDVVASDERFLVFCEVKTRVGTAGAALGPLVAIGPRKRHQLRRMAGEWLRRRAAGDRPHPPDMRFDAIGIRLSPARRVLELEHVEGAF
jgi:putative endonuclease